MVKETAKQTKQMKPNNDSAVGPKPRVRSGIKKKRKPTFNVLNFGFRKRVKERWRKPRGTHNKKRMKFAWTGASPKIGYRNPECIRGMHPSGLKEMLISTDKQLNESVKEVLIRIAANVGMKKRRVIEEKAKKYGLDIINPLKENSKGEKKS